MTRKVKIENGKYSKMDVNNEDIYVENNQDDESDGQSDSDKSKQRREYREFNDNRTGEKREGWH